MKKINNFTIVLVLMMLVLSACSGNSTEATGVDSTATGTTISDANGSDVEMDEVSQLVFGTILLDETENQVTVEQAQTMLPLWQLYQAMLSEDTTASEELDAIIKQIKAVFTEDQMTMMASFDYSDQGELMAQIGIESFDMAGREGMADEDFEGVLPEGFESGDFQRGEGPQGGNSIEQAPSDGMEGGFIGGFAGEGSGENMNIDPETLTTAQAERGGGFGNMQSMIFIPAVIEYLEAIIAA